MRLFWRMGSYSEDAFLREQQDILRRPAHYLSQYMAEEPDKDDEAFSLGCMRLTMVAEENVKELTRSSNLSSHFV